jgi:GntR family transcriptional regulator
MVQSKSSLRKKNPSPLLSIRVDKNDPAPAYMQIAEAMKSMLRDGTIPPGEAMPPERVLAQRFGVSRMTMRQANDFLEREGLIERHPGRGTFAVQNRIIKQEQETRSFSEEIRRRGGVPSSRLISFRSMGATKNVAEYFGIAPDDPIYEIQRVRLADGVPIALESVQVPAAMCPLLERFNLVDHSFYQILEENYGIELARSEEEISALQPNATQKKLLALPRNVAVLHVKRRTFTSDGRPLELAVTTYRGDLYTAQVNSTRQQKPKAPALHLAASSKGKGAG